MKKEPKAVAAICPFCRHPYRLDTEPGYCRICRGACKVETCACGRGQQQFQLFKVS
jgi:hypothetical protein